MPEAVAVPHPPHDGTVLAFDFGAKRIGVAVGETALAQAFVEHFGCGTVDALLEGVMRWQINLSGRMAPLVFATAHSGDAVAQDVIAKAGRTIGANVVAVARRLGMLDEPFDLVTAGGVFSSRSPVLNDSLLSTVRAHAAGVRMVHWEARPVVGAVLLAIDLLRLGRAPEPTFVAEQVTNALATLGE